MTIHGKSENKIFSKNLPLLIFASILLSTAVLSAHYAFAMGQAPSTCSNRYYSTITAMKITVGHRTYNPILHPNMTIQIRDTSPYTVVFTIHASSTSIQENSLNGSTWYDTSAIGYQFGQCVNDVSPNQDVTLILSEKHPANMPSTGIQAVSWTTFAASNTTNSVTYNIKWTR